MSDSTPASSSSSKKLILIVGGTGAQGIAVIDALLEPSADGTPSPYTVRVLTRNTEGRRAQELQAKGVELVVGSFRDFKAVQDAMRGCYGAWINTDGFTVGEDREVYAGMRIFEAAKQLGTIQHYVYSGLDYVFKKGGYQQQYKADHYDGKGRVIDWLRSQPSTPSPSAAGLTWSVITSGPYMDMLTTPMFGPLNKRPDGTYVFASPIGSGSAPMVALKDVGFWARYSFDHREEVSGKEYEIVSQMVDWETLVKTFSEVTGEKAVYKRMGIEEWFALFGNVDQVFAIERRSEGGGRSEDAEGLLTFKQNFSAFWRLYRDGIIKRDVNWVRSVHPGTRTLESWMRENNYTGALAHTLLKNTEDGHTGGLNWDLIKQL